MELQLPPVAFRATSSNEPTEDLRHPVFDSSVVPVIFYPTWQENFGGCDWGALLRGWE